MQRYSLDPLSDSRWSDFVASHPRASVFHEPGWLKSLAATYGYRTMALTSSAPGKQLRDGIVFCEIKSWVTGSRLVSLPFSDHVEPLLNQDSAPLDMERWVQQECRKKNWKYIEIRPASVSLPTSQPMVGSHFFWLHTLDLTRPTEQLFRNLHKSCVQRRIRHAERQQLSYERSSSEELLDEFYKLLMMTRRRFRLLPQPRVWFRNLIAFMGPNAEIRLVRKEGKAIAAILTLRHRKTVVYKYGCSDEAFHHLGAMPFLFWKLIEESKNTGIELLDLGRTELTNGGLIEFKERLGAARTPLTYIRYPESAKLAGMTALNLPGARGLFSILPNTLSSKLGLMTYRHIG